MSIQIKRIQSNESGDFNPQGGRTRAHIEVPGSIGFTDLANSHVILRSKPTIDNGSKVSNVLPCYFAQPSTSEPTDPVAISGGQAVIKNARVTAKDHGILNEQRDQNVISANLDWYTKSSSAMGLLHTLAVQTNRTFLSSRFSFFKRLFLPIGENNSLLPSEEWQV